MLNDPILQYLDFSQSFYVCTDTSDHAVGACLAQMVDNKLHPVSFASRVLSDTETRYSTTKREALAVVWALKHWRHIIFGYEVTVYTDHKPLVGLFSSTLPEDATLARWAVQVQKYSPKLKYFPGRQNSLADTMSRININIGKTKSIEEIEDEFEEAILTMDENQEPIEDDTWNKLPFSLEDLVKAQKKDRRIQSIRDRLLCNKRSEEKGKYGKLKPYFMENDLLHFKRIVSRTGEKTVYINVEIPDSHAEEVIKLCHEPKNIAHYGVEHTIKRLQKHFHFLNENKRVTEVLNVCQSCIENTGRITRSSKLSKTPLPSYPFDITGGDLLGPLPPTIRGNRYILVLTDYLTRYSVIVPIPNKTAEVITEAIRVT